MGEYVIGSIIMYAIFIGFLWAGKAIGGAVGSVIFWLSLSISSFLLARVILFTRDYYTNIFAKCHKAAQEYNDAEMKKNLESKN